MRLYDLVLVVRSSLSEAQRKKTIDTVKGWIKEAKVIKEQSLGQKMLAFPIKKELDAYYLLISLEVKEKVPADFEKKILAQEDILRHLLIRNK